MNREEFIRDLIKQKGMSVKSFAEFAEIPYTTLHSMLERGVGKAAVDNVIKVCKALGITVEELESSSVDSGIDEPMTIAAHKTDGSKFTDEEMKMINAFIDTYRKSKS